MNAFNWRTRLLPIRSAPDEPAATDSTTEMAGRRQRQFAAAACLALALLAGVAIGRFTATWSPAVTPALAPLVRQVAAVTAAPLVSGTQADQSQEAAIKQVIQRGNDEQAQAIAARDPSAMADTSTPDHYQELVRINQDLLDHGVTSIALVKLEWGPISVNGTTATATTYETWSTTYSDGTTEQSRDRNDYTLVLDQGTWKIRSDNQPDAGSPAPGAPGVPESDQPSPAGAPPAGSSISRNWAGYTATGGTFTAVSGTWTVPQPTAGGAAGIDATWVGIGGVQSRDLIQAGTQETQTGSGRVVDTAWIEMLPQASHSVPLAVHPGDSVTVSITEAGTDTWQIAFTNNTTGQTYQQTEHYASSRSSAEWVEEAPSSRRGVAPLDDFGTVQFSNGSAVKDGQTVTIAGAGARPITMATVGDQPLAIPSALGSDGASFSVTRTAVPAGLERGGSPFPGRFPFGG